MAWCSSLPFEVRASDNSVVRLRVDLVAFNRFDAVVSWSSTLRSLFDPKNVFQFDIVEIVDEGTGTQFT